MLRLVRNQSLTTLEKPATSTYIPSFLMFFSILNIMNEQMLHNFSFGRSAPHWHPFVSQAYFGVIVQIHVMRVMRGILYLPPAIMNFLETFENMFPLDSIIIPGPLVPILESITAFEGNFSHIGNVCADFATLTANAAGIFTLPNGLHTIWPHVLFVIDQIRREAETAIPANYADHRYFHNIFSTPATAASLTTTGQMMSTPHGRHTPFVAQTRLEAFRSWIQRINFPSRVALDDIFALPTNLSLDQWLVFVDANNAYLPWFEAFAPVMAVFSRHFEGSVSMSRISTRGLAAASLVSRMLPGSHFAPAPATFVAVAGNVPAHFVPDPIVNSSANIRHNDPNTEELAEQYGMISMVNQDFSAGNNGINVPGNGILRTGPYWTYPSLRSLNNVNIYPGIALTVRDFYVKERIQ